MGDMENKFLFVICQERCCWAPFVVRVDASGYSIVRPLIIAVFIGWFVGLGCRTCRCSLYVSCLL
jgi:hypothetical protein